MSGRLNVLAQVASVFARDMRHGTHQECQARGVLLALVAAIHNDSLDSLVEQVRPWMREEVARIDALRDAEAFEQASEAAAEMELPSADLDDYWQVGNRLPGDEISDVQAPD
ncbi:MAG: hypothetical protein IT328_04400 [Caldilineaceae bacterium]|nr:hypothetical protein [Caldilineaceae bacterium]